jgi:hypothetical protein
MGDSLAFLGNDGSRVWRMKARSRSYCWVLPSPRGPIRKIAAFVELIAFSSPRTLGSPADGLRRSKKEVSPRALRSESMSAAWRKSPRAYPNDRKRLPRL